MKKTILPVFLIVFISAVLTAQTLVDAQYLGAKTQQQLVTDYGIPLFKNGVKIYKVLYLTPNVQGEPSIASGLMTVPDDLTKTYPLLCYQHGTSSDRNNVPSKLNFESNLSIVFAGMGYMTVTPDYIGLGDSPGLHPYVHAETEASAGVDIMRSAREFAESNSVFLNGQVFVTGYSQGGHAAMALHRQLETELSDEFSVAASAPMSGPYSIGEVMKDLMLSEQVYNSPAYLIYTLISYQYVYGNLYSSIQDAFKPAYAGVVQQFYNEDINLDQLNTQLINLLTANEGASIPVKVIKDELVDEVKNNPDHPVNIAMDLNNVYDWAPAAPTRLFYCEADDQVPYENSLVAEGAMNGNGAANVQAVSVNPLLNHGECLTPAVFSAILFFQQYQQIGNAPVATTWKDAGELSIFPNPAGDRVFIKNLPAPGAVRLFSLNGELVRLENLSSGDAEILTGNLPNGFYLLQANGEFGVMHGKIFVNN